MYSVKIRDHVMIAHSLKADGFFGPAEKLHGATYIVDVVFFLKELDEHNVVIDIGYATSVVKEVIQPLSYHNLDEMEEFSGKLTTTEYLAKYIHDQVKSKVAGFPGKLKVTLGESHVAWASYEDHFE